jgi:ribonuclease HI
MAQLLIYTDGSSRGNPGPGGYGIVMLWGNNTKEISAGYRLTTNNRMELLAVIKALENLTKQQIPLTIFTDSKYVVDSVTKGWLQTWIKTGFKGGKKNRDLWERYDAISKNFIINFQWVKGHANNMYNNKCDVLATTAADNKSAWLIDEEYEKGDMV